MTDTVTGVSFATNRPVLYPCDRGTGTLTGYHHFEASPSGIVACRYCGRKAPDDR